MTQAILLDSGPLGLVTNPRMSPEAEACRKWLRSLVATQTRVIIPEIADYETRRELLRLGKVDGLKRLEALIAQHDYLPVTTQAWRQAALFWAQARQQGRPTADPFALDGDVILAGQAATLGLPAEEVVVATTNAGHIGRFVTAQAWQDIS